MSDLCGDEWNMNILLTRHVSYRRPDLYMVHPPLNVLNGVYMIDKCPLIYKLSMITCPTSLRTCII